VSRGWPRGREQVGGAIDQAFAKRVDKEGGIWPQRVLELGASALDNGACAACAGSGRWPVEQERCHAVSKCGPIASGRPEMNITIFHLIQKFQINLNLQRFQTYLSVLEKIK
jgi:hypothetical protein